MAGTEPEKMERVIDSGKQPEIKKTYTPADIINTALAVITAKEPPTFAAIKAFKSLFPKSTTVLYLLPGEEITLLDEQQMNRMGWYRK